MPKQTVLDPTQASQRVMSEMGMTNLITSVMTLEDGDCELIINADGMLAPVFANIVRNIERWDKAVEIRDVNINEIKLMVYEAVTL